MSSTTIYSFFVYWDHNLIHSDKKSTESSAYKKDLNNDNDKNSGNKDLNPTGNNIN